MPEFGDRNVRSRRVMAVSSGGGHWVEMRRLLPAFEGLEMTYVSTDTEPDVNLAGARYYCIHNFTRHNALTSVKVIAEMVRILRRERPEVVITTGAAPGLIALVLAKLLLRSRTIWVDSLAAAETMSLSGRMARPFADAWLTQWEALARPGGPEHWGSVL